MEAVQFTIRTEHQSQFIEITAQIREIIREKRLQSGICQIFIPHTTAGITINENADPDVVHDILAQLDKIVPQHNNYRHGEGNSAAHIKAMLSGFSLQLIVENGHLLLGTWQGIYFCEYDGPRTRKVIVKLIENRDSQSQNL